MKTLLLYLLVFLAILNHHEIILENQTILFFFLETLMPSLFLLCVLIHLLPLPKCSFLDIIFYKLFHFDSATFFCIIKLIFLGNPTSSYYVQSLYLNKQINQSQAKRLIYCCAIPSISFMLMTLSFLTTSKISWIVFLIHLSSIFILFLLTRNTPISIGDQSSPISLTKAILFTIKTMAFILSYLFIVNSIKSLFIIYFPTFKLMIHLLFEFSSACFYIRFFPSILMYLFIIIGFGGFCSHLQVMDGCNECDLSYFQYFKWRVIHMLLDLVIYFCLFH